MTKRERYSKKLLEQTLKCEECKGTAYALWSHPSESGRGTDFFGLCEPCEVKFIAECEANVRAMKEAKERADSGKL